MEGFTSQFVSLHTIDAENSSVNSIDIKNKQDLELFISGIIKRRLEDKEGEEFQERSIETKVLANIMSIEKDPKQRQNRLEKIAAHLLDTEKRVNEKLKPFTVIKKGILVQSLLEYNKERYYLLAKMEANRFLDGGDWTPHSGFPFEKLEHKSCLIKFVINPGIEKIWVYDSNPEVAVYWWNDFLELDKVKSDKYNTEQSLKAIESELSRKLQKKYKVDLFNLKKGVRNFYKSNDNFVIKQMADLVFKNYQPSNPELKSKMESITKDISELPKAKNFNGKFTIKKDKVTKILRKPLEHIIPVTPQIDVVLKDSIQNLEFEICFLENPLDRFIVVRVNDEVDLTGIPKCDRTILDAGDSQ